MIPIIVNGKKYQVDVIPTLRCSGRSVKTSA